MEGSYLVTSNETVASPNLSVYGAVNPGFVNDKGKSDDCNGSSIKEDNSYVRNGKPSSVESDCGCPAENDCSQTDCSQTKIQFEPWARYKTITMAVGLSIFGIWIIVIAIVAKQGKL